jgi:hypothetical protein
LGYVRDDGKTMVSQPHLGLDPKKMWTLDDDVDGEGVALGVVALGQGRRHAWALCRVLTS